MMTDSTPGYPLPRSRDEFTRVTLKLLRRHWQLPELERFQPYEGGEAGIDLLEISGSARLAAVRCEFRELHDPLEASQLKEAADRGALSRLPIGRLVVATTARSSPALRQHLLELNRANRAAGRWPLELLAWDDIEQLLDEYPDVVTEIGSGANFQALTKSSSVVRFQPKHDFAAPDSSSPFAEEITSAEEHLHLGQYQMARFWLMRIRQSRTLAALKPGERFRVLTDLAVAWFGEGEPRKAAMLFIAARTLAPEAEMACTNEVIGYELLGERQRALALAEKLHLQFPGSARALALWLNNTPPDYSAERLEASIAGELAEDGEVSLVMARRALAESDYGRAERFGRRASVALPEHCASWLALGQSILLGEICRSGSTVLDVWASGEESRVREAEDCFTKAIRLAHNDGEVESQVQGLIGRAQARIALRDGEGAGQDVEDAHRLEREDANGLCEYGILLRVRGDLSEAIDVFRHAAAAGGRADAEYHLAVALHQREAPGDLHEAAQLLPRLIERPGFVSAADFPAALECMVDVFGRLERWSEAEELVLRLQADRISEVSRLVLLAQLQLSQRNHGQASALANRALGALTAATSAVDRRALATLLHCLGRYREALDLWKELARSAGTVGDARRLRACAWRLGRSDVTLEIARSAFGDSSSGEPAAKEPELALLERYDPELALQVTEAHLTEHPDDKLLRLRRSLIAHRLGRYELVECQPDVMPAPSEV
ncbi:MAG: hypothetical protein ACE5HB_03975, partial [Terriglobia bacterium]